MIVVFDAQCLLCNAWVKFLLRHDRREVFQFASIQGERGRALLAAQGLRVDGLKTLLVVDEAGAWQHTEAIIRVLHQLGWPWRAAWVLRLIPSALRDPLYRWVAKHRYRLFGRTQTCLIPTPDVARRFLD